MSDKFKCEECDCVIGEDDAGLCDDCFDALNAEDDEDDETEETLQ